MEDRNFEYMDREQPEVMDKHWWLSAAVGLGVASFTLSVAALVLFYELGSWNLIWLVPVLLFVGICCVYVDCAHAEARLWYDRYVTQWHYRHESQRNWYRQRADMIRKAAEDAALLHNKDVRESQSQTELANERHRVFDLQVKVDALQQEMATNVVRSAQVIDDSDQFETRGQD